MNRITCLVAKALLFTTTLSGFLQGSEQNGEQAKPEVCSIDEESASRAWARNCTKDFSNKTLTITWDAANKGWSGIGFGLQKEWGTMDLESIRKTGVLKMSVLGASIEELNVALINDKKKSAARIKPQMLNKDKEQLIVPLSELKGNLDWAQVAGVSIYTEGGVNAMMQLQFPVEILSTNPLLEKTLVNAAEENKSNTSTPTGINNPAAIAVPYPVDTPEWKSKIISKIQDKVLDESALKASDLVLIGDSITWQWQEQGQSVFQSKFQKPNGTFQALDIGVPGDRTENILYRIQPHAEGGMGLLDSPALQPKYFVVMAGVNHIWDKKLDPLQVAEGVEAILKQIKRLKPSAKIILVSILPQVYAPLNDTAIVPINRKLASVAEANSDSVIFLNLYPIFLNESGESEPRYHVKDGLHLSEEGYRRYSEALLTLLSSQ